LKFKEIKGIEWEKRSRAKTLVRVKDRVGEMGCKTCMGHATCGSCRWRCIDEIHALSSSITIVGAWKTTAKV
jgi:hypothetical protein